MSKFITHKDKKRLRKNYVRCPHHIENQSKPFAKIFY